MRFEPLSGLLRVLLLHGDIDQACLVYEAFPAELFLSASALAEMFPLQIRLNRFVDALNTVEKLFAFGQDVSSLLSQLANVTSHQCEWVVRDRVTTLLLNCARTQSSCVIDLLSVFSITDDTELHAECAGKVAAKIRSKHRATQKISDLSVKPRTIHTAPKRLRIAYLGGQFSRHATTLLLTGVIEQHDRDKFEVMLFDYSVEDGSEARTRILRAFDRVEFLRQAGPRAAAARISQEKPDILIDTQGYTAGTRSEILAYRPCALQINFLGYVVTQSAEWCDYVIADKVVLPESERPHWREAVIYMPNSCYPNDRSRPVPNPATEVGRTAFGLPEGVFVFACFNSLHKLTPEMFRLWIDILRDAPNSVLWLRDSNAHARENLKRQATSLGVSPTRLVFAKSSALPEHMDRHEYADLYLDTFPFGAHTMGCDALWAGLPLITMVGRSFASRVAASLLCAVDLSQLAVTCASEYREKCLFYYNNPEELAPLRAKLRNARSNSTLFDTALYCRHLETAFQQIVDQSRRDIFLN